MARQCFSQVNAKMLGMVLNQVGLRDLRRYAHHHKFYDKYYEIKQTETHALEKNTEELPSVPLN